MKLFLASTFISERQASEFSALVRKDLSDISFALIENAADVYQEDCKGFVFETRTALEKLGMKLEVVDLLDFTNENDLYFALEHFDVIWVGGGNTYYIRYLMNKIGFDKIISKLINKGTVYGGGSAGAIVAQKTLKYYDIVDDCKVAPIVMYEGLRLSDLIIIPHWGTEEFQSLLERIKESYIHDGFNVVTIRDDQAVIVEGDNWRII